MNFRESEACLDFYFEKLYMGRYINFTVVLC